MLEPGVVGVVLRGKYPYTSPNAGTDPLLQLEYETQPPSGPGATRCLSHPRELALRGIPVMCTACRARRDWLLINHSRNVWIVCRCSNQWLEPEISRADFDDLITISGGTTYPSVEQGLAALGFDGAFAGTYLTQAQRPRPVRR